ncbi:hypothetical protein H634G_11636 [Metarhizium anisopliae BRIP 53293]|uniref:Uncharacterized protein n=1 Tax=Metarhizium anisopliae BRIP 53293 TaxID=1291518 RepID=A0A0D9NHU3_METAN|nr:hypothetical protein H634G_11636 [Metarhizium anisopliae BRIP 53293]
MRLDFRHGQLGCDFTEKKAHIWFLRQKKPKYVTSSIIHVVVFLYFVKKGCWYLQKLCVL